MCYAPLSWAYPGFFCLNTRMDARLVNEARKVYLDYLRWKSDFAMPKFYA